MLRHADADADADAEQSVQLDEVCTELLDGLAALARRLSPDEAERIAALLEPALDGDVETVRHGLQRALPALERKLVERESTAAYARAQLKLKLRTMQDELSAARERTARDALTGLFNRGAFDTMFAQQVELSHATGQALALLVIDIDFFKQVNDRYGHIAGDQVLRVFGKTLSRSFGRARDVVARYGGEEFAVLLVDAAPDHVMQLAERLVARVREGSVQSKAGSVSVTCSVGFAQLSPDDSADELLERADAALYAAKAAGRDRAVDGDAHECSRRQRVQELFDTRVARNS